MHEPPGAFGLPQCRWTLGTLRQRPFLHLSSNASLHHLLERLGISYKRGRHYLHSPDPTTGLSLPSLPAAKPKAVIPTPVYLDELTYYRQPTIAQPRAAWSPPARPP